MQSVQPRRLDQGLVIMNRTRSMTTAAVVAATAAATGGGGLAIHDALAAGAAVNTASSAVPAATATVVRSTITTSEQDSGTFGYAGSFTVYNGLRGTVTWLPAAGAVIRPGQRLFAVDGQDVILFTGRQPAWREFAPGMGDGPDVGELQRNLITLGYDPYHAIIINDQYDSVTQAAVLRWQAALGLPLAQRDAVIPLGQVAFLPSRVRVAAVNTGTGATAVPGATVLAVTSTRPVAYVALPTSEKSLVRRGEPVTVTLPDGAATPGRVLSVGTAIAPGQGQQGQGPGSSQSSSSQSADVQSAAPTITVVVGLTDPSAAAGLDQVPVQVAIATQAERNVLVAPISALLARPGGGYQVMVVHGQTQQRVTVQTGLFDDFSGTVAIAGPGIAAGTRVEVPAP
jgi:peptidoglycan hydrolase-like protein with peptidoglycan-binding domain